MGDARVSIGFKGLFIGIDRYASPGVNWLSCAVRDAKALHALFTTVSAATLLLDDQATVAAIGRRFDTLVACNPDDVVVVAFSGHGTSTHELVTHDSDARDLPNARSAWPWARRSTKFRKDALSQFWRY
jgi:hypothetical protein